MHAIDAQRPCDVLEARLADIGKLGPDLAAHLAEGIFRDPDPVGFGDAFETGGNVDAVAENIVSLDQHIADMDSDAPHHAAVGRNSGALLMGFLQMDSGMDH